MKILKEVSVKSVMEVCREAGEKLAVWLLCDKPRGGVYTKRTSLREETIEAMPQEFRDWLVGYGFIGTEKEFNINDFEIYRNEHSVRLKWKGYTVLFIDIERSVATLVPGLPKDFPCPTDAEGRMNTCRSVFYVGC